MNHPKTQIITPGRSSVTLSSLTANPLAGVHHLRVESSG